MRKAVLLVFLLLTATLPMFASADSDPIRQRSTTTNFSWSGIATSVQVSGEWDDWNERTNLSENNGQWSASLEIAPGMYCYKLIIDDNWIFDPSEPYRGYCGDVENSVVRVPDSSKPMFTHSIENNILTILWHAGAGGGAPESTPLALATGLWDENTWTWTLDITTLVEGKNTLHITGEDVDGNIADDLLLPIWNGPQSDFIWDDALIYMLMTDRFVNADGSNDPDTTNAAQGAEWMGGDFAGVTQMIQSGYFTNLGVNALWLTPFNSAANGTGQASDGQHEVSAYHGYWPVAPREVDSRLGTESELHTLVQAAHDAGIRILGDFVINHVHEDHPYYTENPEWFNDGCLCGTDNCDWTEHRLDCMFRPYMPDVNWRVRNASEQFIEDIVWWFETFDLDGGRIDAVKHVEDLAITNLAVRINERFETAGTDYYLKGETAMGWAGHNLADNANEYGTINRYIGENALDGQADFVLYHAVVDNVFTSGNMDYQHLDYWTLQSQEQYADNSIMVPFVGSHDVPRFSSRADTGTTQAWNQWVEDGLPGQPGVSGPYDAALQAFTWLLTTPGAAMIYQGDEYGEFGGADPDNRHMLRLGDTQNNREKQLLENISSIGLIRHDSDALRRGSYQSLHSGVDTIAWSMTSESEQAIIAMNRGVTPAEFDLDIDWVANDSLNSIVMDIEHKFTLDPHSVAIFISPYDESTGRCIFGSTDIESPIFVNIASGNDEFIGTSECPLETIQSAVNRLENSGEIIVQAGNYQESISFSDFDDIVIRTDGSRVILDGSKDVISDLGGTWETHNTGESGTIHKINVGIDAWQLFVDREEMIPARWPNARFDDGSVFNTTHNWAQGTMDRDKFKDENNSWVYPYENGEIIDAGSIAGGHNGLNASGINPLGSIAILNVGSFKSWSRTITDYNETTGILQFEPVDGWKTKHHKYFLEGKLELLDVPGEWFFDRENSTIFFMTPNNQNPNEMNIRVKTQPYSITCSDSNRVTIEGFEFFASTFRFDNCDNSVMRNATLVYPSTSKRSLGVAGEDSSERWITRFDSTSDSRIENSAFLYTDGGAFELYGGRNTVNNSYFYHIDWTSCDSVSLMTTAYFGGSDNVFSNNTVHNVGASSVLNPGNSATVEYNDISDTGHLQTDGAVIQLMMGQQTDAMISHNWIHDTPKYGIRMDGPMGGTNEGRNATVHHNVMWNIAGGIMVKGDYHNISQNTVFGIEPGSNGVQKNNIIAIADGGNENSTFVRNAADRISSHRQENFTENPVPGYYSENFNGYIDSGGSVESQLVNPANLSFCPIVGSAIANIGAGAYTSDCIDPWTAGTDWDFYHPTTPVEGCTDILADNFDSSAEIDDGSCTYPEPDPVRGCMDTNATNYDSSAEIDDGSCTYPEPDPVGGCMDTNATNYDSSAEIDDGSCVYPEPEPEPEPVYGCTENAANNFNENATEGDGSCDFDLDDDGILDDVDLCPVTPWGEAVNEDGCGCLADASCPDSSTNGPEPEQNSSNNNDSNVVESEDTDSSGGITDGQLLRIVLIIIGIIGCGLLITLVLRKRNQED